MPIFHTMSTISDSTLGIGGSDSGGSIQQPMVEREVVLIGDSLSEEVPRKVFDNGSLYVLRLKRISELKDMSMCISRELLLVNIECLIILCT